MQNVQHGKNNAAGTEFCNIATTSGYGHMLDKPVQFQASSCIELIFSTYVSLKKNCKVDIANFSAPFPPPYYREV